MERNNFLLAEFSALRDEISKRLSFQHQLIVISLVVAGTFFSLSFNSESDPKIIYIYPVIALFLASGWAYNNIRLKQIGLYIKNNIESNIINGGWETYRIEHLHSNNIIRHSMSVIFGRGIFIGTQLIFLTLSLFKFGLPVDIFNPTSIGLFIDILSIILTFYLTKRTIV